MSRAPYRPPQLVGRVFRGSAQVRSGRLTPDQVRGPAWRRLAPDVHCDASLPLTHLLRVQGTCLAVPRAVVSGRSAATLWGVPLAGPADDVELTVPPGTAAVTLPGVRARRAHLGQDEVTGHRGLPVTTPTATAVEVARTSPDLDSAVVALDRLVDAGIVLLGDVRSAAGRATGRGCRRVRAAAALADGLAASPQETRVRLLLHRSGLPRPVAQFTVLDGGRFVARVDFGWPEQRVAVEYDGLWHRDPRQFADDRRRLNRLTAAGWRVVFVTAADLRDPVALLARVARALFDAR